jgi:hypothetical protein
MTENSGKPIGGSGGASFSLNLDQLEDSSVMEKSSPLKSPKHKLGNKIADLASKFEKKIETQQKNASFLSARERNQELEQLKKTSTKSAYTSLNFFSDLIEKKKKETTQWNSVSKSVSVVERVTHSPSPDPSVPTSPKLKSSPKESTFLFFKLKRRIVPPTLVLQMNQEEEEEEEEPTKVLKNKGLAPIDTYSFQHALQSLEVKMKVSPIFI